MILRGRRRRDVVCRQLVEMVTDYLEGDLDPVERTAVRAHLEQCGHCQGYVEQVRRMLELTVRTDEPVEIPAELLDTLTTRYQQRF